MFLNFQSAEHILRRTVNEGEVMTALRKREFMVEVHEVDMLGIIRRDWLACSPDRIALLNVPFLGHFGYEEHQLTSVEIKTNVVTFLMDKRQQNASLETQMRSVGSPGFLRLILLTSAGSFLIRPLLRVSILWSTSLHLRQELFSYPSFTAPQQCLTSAKIFFTISVKRLLRGHIETTSSSQVLLTPNAANGSKEI